MKRSAALLLALCLCLGLCPVGSAEDAPGFSDVSPGDWFAPYVQVCAQEGLLQGVGDGLFSPNGLVNEDEAIVMAARVLWQADGGEGPLPAGPSAEELAGALGERLSLLTSYSAESLAQLSREWSWDGFSYLLQRSGEAGLTELPVELTTYPVQRGGFFRLLAFATQGMELELLNPVTAVPGTRDEGILRLYRAGLLSGVDGCGSLEAQRHLTRAEAAAILARIAQPQLRQRFTLQPPPWQDGYTLTYLAQSRYHNGVTYPVLPLSGQGILTLDGEMLDWPGPGHIYSSGLDRDDEYCSFFLVDSSNRTHTTVLMDAKGNYAVPQGAYENLYATGDGHLLGTRRPDPLEAMAENQWFLLSSDGTVEAQLPSTYGTPDNNWYSFNEGVCPWQDEDTGLVGYVDAAGNWVLPPTWVSADNFYHGYATVWNGEGCGVIDHQGEFVIPPRYQSLTPGYLSPGCDAPMLWNYTAFDGSEGWIDASGVLYPGVAYGTYQNGWFAGYSAELGSAYYDLLGNQLSEVFDWCGPLTVDGRGFVCLDGCVYRIEFQP